MIDQLTYANLSLDGIFKAYCKHYSIEEKDNAIDLPKEIGDIHIQKLLLPGDVGVVFADFNFKVDSLIIHKAEKEQKYVLWISMLELESQLLIWGNEGMTTSKKLQPTSFLLNSLFEFKQFRKEGTKGKSLLIFIPPYLLQSFEKNKTKGNLLGKFYAIMSKGLALRNLTEIEEEKVNHFFDQWKNHKNIVGMAKSIFQLLEWYFSFLTDFLYDETKLYSLTEEQAKDLFALQNYLLKSLNEPKPNLELFEKTVNTPLAKLKKLFVQMYDKTLYDFVIIEKMKSAEVLLTNTDKNVSEIAYEFGFSNPSNFSVAFKKYYELMPNEYRVKNKKISEQ
jgi:AraC-like DNA-binding protein